MRTRHAVHTRLAYAAGAGALAAPLLIAPVATAEPLPAPAEGIVINEVRSNDDNGGFDFIEVYNTGDSDADLTGWYLSDDKDKDKLPFDDGTILAPGGYLAIYVDDEATYPDTNFGLGKGDAARLFNADGELVDSYTWDADGHATPSNSRFPDGTGDFVAGTLATPGAANVGPDSDAGDGGSDDTGSGDEGDNSDTPDAPAAPLAPADADIVVNEVSSNHGADFVELYNNTDQDLDLAGWGILDNDPDHSVTPFAAGTVITAHGFLTFETEAAFGFGLGSADSARLLNAEGTEVDSYSWTSHAAFSYGRNPDGTGEFAPTTADTRGSANNFDAPIEDPENPENPDAPKPTPWNGPASLTDFDESDTFGEDMSGVAYESASVLWAVNNGNGTLHRLDMKADHLSESVGWVGGHRLRYQDGTGTPDAEGVALINGSAVNGVLVGTERNNDVKSTSRLSVLHFDVTGAGAGTGDILAKHEWNLNSYYPADIDANAGIEGIAWVSDETLVKGGLLDESTGRVYDPTSYGAHLGGVVFVGVEATGTVNGFVLEESGKITLVTSFETAFPGVMELEYDAPTNQMWAVCDDVCGTQLQVFELKPVQVPAVKAGAQAAAFKALVAPVGGTFDSVALYNRPAGTENFANEGFAISPVAVNGVRQVVFSDDAETGGHAFRVGGLNAAASVPDDTNGGPGDGDNSGGNGDNGTVTPGDNTGGNTGNNAGGDGAGNGDVVDNGSNGNNAAGNGDDSLAQTGTNGSALAVAGLAALALLGAGGVLVARRRAA